MSLTLPIRISLKIWSTLGVKSEKWVLELRGGRQITIPLSLYHSPGSMSDFSDLEGVVGQGNNTFKEEGHLLSWADDCDGALDNVSVYLDQILSWGTLMGVL